MQGNGKYQHRGKSYFQNCLIRVKRKGRPRSRVFGQVVYLMYALIEKRMMHEPMRPVEISIVKENDKDSSGDVIRDAVISEMLIDLRIKYPMRDSQAYQDANRGEHSE